MLDSTPITYGKLINDLFHILLGTEAHTPSKNKTTSTTSNSVPRTRILRGTQDREGTDGTVHFQLSVP